MGDARVAYRGMRSSRHSVNDGGISSELGPSGLLTVLGFLALVALVILLFPVVRPPTVEEVERDIWSDWARLSVDSEGKTIVDGLLENRRAASQRLLETLGKLVSSEGDRFVVRTDVRYLRIRDRQDQVFAEWRSQSEDDVFGNWKEITVNLEDPLEGKVGTLEVAYQFYGGGLESLPNIRRLRETYSLAFLLVAALALVTMIAALANLSRIRERAGRLQSQQVTLDLARQMCHELRNGLWAFSLEGRNLRRLFAVVDEYFAALPLAITEALGRVGLDSGQQERFQRQLEKSLAAKGVDPNSDVRSSNELAKDAEQQIQSFTRYINLTVEELDRNLLGSNLHWEPKTIRLTEGWNEALELLQLRLRSAGVEWLMDAAAEEDWIVGDRRALVHLFVNLVKNAVEAMRESPSPRIVRFGVVVERGEVRCHVRNGGKPIAAEHLPHIFQPGFSTKAGAGRGTGLALVAESVARMHGSIRVSSSEVEGTTFHLVFPQVPPPSHP
ncbi:MAG: HAMP domain-containing sensor histidine kinase [Planctomycetota bacterium]